MESTLLRRLVLVEDLDYKKLYIPVSRIRSSQEFFAFATTYLYPKDKINVYEIFTAVFLDKGNTPIGYTQYRGSIKGVLPDMQEVLAVAISIKASSVIISHNHPSGRVQPSESDNMLTVNTKKAFSMQDINLIDHIIVTETNYYSYADEGKLDISSSTYYVMGKEICSHLSNGDSLEEYLKESDIDHFGILRFIEGVTPSRVLADALLGYEDFQTISRENFDILASYKNNNQ